MDDQELVIRAQSGDETAFSRLVDRYSSRVLSWTSYYAGTRDSSDVAQEIWITVYRKLWQLEDTAKFVPWLRKLTVYHCLNYYKDKGRKTEVYLEPSDWVRITEFVSDNAGVEELLDRKELSQLVWQQIDQLSPQYRTILYLRYFNERSLAEISDLVYLPVSTLKWRLYQGRLLLRGRLARAIRERGT